MPGERWRRCSNSTCRSLTRPSSSAAMRAGCTGSIRRRRSSATASPRSSGPTGGRPRKKCKAALAADASVTRVVATLEGRTRIMTTTRHFAVFDSDSHVVEPPELWEKYLDPEFRVLGKQALWRHDGATNSYLKINGEVDPRHDEPQPAAPRDLAAGHDLGRRSANSTPSVRHPMNEGAWDPRARLADMDAMGVDQAFLYPTWFAEGFHLVADPDTAYALARAYNDWIADFCRGRSAPAVRRRDAAAAGHGLHAGGTAPRRRHPVLPRRLHPADVLPGPLLHQPVFRSALGGAGAARPGGRGASDAGPVEPGMDVAWAVRREGEEPCSVRRRCRPAAAVRSPAAAPDWPAPRSSPRFRNSAIRWRRSCPAGSTITCSSPRC